MKNGHVPQLVSHHQAIHEFITLTVKLPFHLWKNQTPYSNSQTFALEII